MNSTDTHYIGINPASSNKDFNYAVLDNNLNLVRLADADLGEISALFLERDSVFVAINAPSGINQGLVKNKLEQESSAQGHVFRSVDIRLSEYELHKRGIAVAGTPSREEFCPAWMQTGFALYRKLSEIGFELYGTEDATRQYLETHPYACYCVLFDGIPFSRPTLEGRLQRQLLLNDKGVRITDAMEFFEEITRFKLLQGVLPTDFLYFPEQLEVLVAAYTAWLAANKPEDVIRVGDKDEGQLILPVKELKEKY
jgi:hypothetical protein